MLEKIQFPISNIQNPISNIGLHLSREIAFRGIIRDFRLLIMKVPAYISSLFTRLTG
jgi:hypothetical protein